MAKHITHKQLAGLIASTLSARSAGNAARHLEECSQCRALHERVVSATRPRYGSLAPGPEVKARIMRSWQDMQGESKRGPGLWAFMAGHPRALIAGSLAAIAAAITALLILTQPPAGIEPPSLTAALVEGSVIINGAPARLNYRARPGSALTLDDQAMVRLAHGPALSITLFGRGSFTIDRMRISGAPERLELECTLQEGILISRTESTVSYTYNTPGARVEPRGTEFLLQASGMKTLVIMKQGSVTVKPADTVKAVDVSAGTRCVVDRTARIEPASPKDLEVFGSMERLRTGNFAPQLLTRPEKNVKRAGDGNSRTGKMSGKIPNKLPIQQTQGANEDNVQPQPERKDAVEQAERERRKRSENKAFKERVGKKKDQRAMKEMQRRINR